MIIQLNDIMKADIIQLEDYDMQLAFEIETVERQLQYCLLYTSPSPRDGRRSRMPSSA